MLGDQGRQVGYDSVLTVRESVRRQYPASLCVTRISLKHLAKPQDHFVFGRLVIGLVPERVVPGYRVKQLEAAAEVIRESLEQHRIEGRLGAVPPGRDDPVRI